MIETRVVDASVVVSVLLGSERDSRWARQQLSSCEWVAPQLLPVEVAAALRRLAHAGVVSIDAATRAHSNLTEMPIGYFPYEPFARRVWQMRNNLTSYDAWYVALAEALDAPLLTLDRSLATGSGIRCKVVAPE